MRIARGISLVFSQSQERMWGTVTTSKPLLSPVHLLVVRKMTERGAEEIIRVLMIEANNDDANKILDVLREAGMQIEAERVLSEEGLAAALQQFKPDVVLTDYALPTIGYRDAIRL